MGDVDKDMVLMARIGAAHGIRGEVRVKPFGDDPLSFTDYGILTTKDGLRSFEVVRARVQKTVAVTQFKGISDRNQAEALNGLDLYVPRDQLPETEEDEFYYSDLTDLPVQDMSGRELGKVISVQDFGAGDLLEVRPLLGKTFYIPFTKAIVPVIDLDAGMVTVDLPEDYFSEERLDETPD
ncbi:ribosome maturation factor RimM [Roseibium algae]|uniref:Ribosome maturation factor RimM n=1 Tax=Roseibium algae TaxID=3123038 RepID=A0ABU8TLA6_9HYPH